MFMALSWLWQGGAAVKLHAQHSLKTVLYLFLDTRPAILCLNHIFFPIK